MFELLSLVVRTFAVAAPLAFPNEHVEGDVKGVQAQPTTASMPAAPMLVPVTFPGRIGLKSYTMTLVGTAPANGDNDGYADADETVNFTPTFVNNSNVTINNFSATLTTSAPTIECVGQSEVTVASIAPGATFTTAPFRFKVAGAGVVNRANIDQVISADFKLTLQTEEYFPPDPLAFTLHLDLNASAPGGTSAFVENFEVGGTNFGRFTLATLDAGKNSLELSDDMRCQYNDPDGPNSQSANNVNCFLGFAADPTNGVNDWHVHEAISAHGGLGRAYTGSKSLHWGVHNSPGTPKRDTVRFKQLDAMKSSIINMPLANAFPELVFSHQVSLVDNRIVIDPGETADRAIVQVNVLTAFGQETVWRNLIPYVNAYDATATDDFFNCIFDPTDDGNDEDSYFDPGDPARRLGPSSACHPERAFACSGDTDYRLAADPLNLCRAHGPGLPGSIDLGTWVQPRFNLQEFAGRRIRLRFLATSVELDTGATWDSAFFNRDDVVADDGWYIDDVRVSSALGLPLTMTADTKAVTPLSCPTCTSVNAVLSVTPDSLPNPGYQVTLSAYGTNVDSCPSGNLEYQFWIDENDNGVAGDAGDTLLRDFSNLWSHTYFAWSSERFAVLTRCSSVTACDSGDGSNTATAQLSVTCPTGVDYDAFNHTIRVDLFELYWSPDVSVVDVIRGWLVGTPTAPATSTLRGAGSFTGSVAECIASNQGPTMKVYPETYPGPGDGFYYLVRGQPSESCAATPPGYTTNSPKERPGRDAEIEADPVAATCP